jgi:hypothetical protein
MNTPVGDVSEPIFQLDHLSLAYPEHRAHLGAPILDDVSVTVERGRVLTLVRPVLFEGTVRENLRVRPADAPISPRSGSARRWRRSGSIPIFSTAATLAYVIGAVVRIRISPASRGRGCS